MTVFASIPVRALIGLPMRTLLAGHTLHGFHGLPAHVRGIAQTLEVRCRVLVR